MHKHLPVLSILSLALVSTSAEAARPSGEGPGNVWQLASGKPVRDYPQLDGVGRPAAWSNFAMTAGGRWRVSWDAHTNVPNRIWGSGIATPGANESEEVAARFARAFVNAYADLLAPGTRGRDFRLVSNVARNGVRVVGFTQQHATLPLAGGQVSLRFKHDRLIAIGSEAFPQLELPALKEAIEKPAADAAALRSIALEVGTPVLRTSAQGPFVRAHVLEDGTIEGRHVFEVVIDTASPRGRWSVDVDAVTGSPYGRRQTLMFSSGVVAFRVPARRPGSTRIDAPALRLNVTVTETGTTSRNETTDDAGMLTWTSTQPVTVTTSVQGPLVRVVSEGPAAATGDLQLADQDTAVWDRSGTEFDDSQLTTFIAARNARDYVLELAPRLGYLNRQLIATVNIDGSCNAFSDGADIAFFRGDNQCENTARLPDVVRHEYAHGIHAQSVIPGAGDFDGTLSEGASDYLAATIVDDSGMGRGFFRNNNPLRELDPADGEWTWPDDRGGSHQSGLIFAGALWDLRKLMIERYGFEDGVRRTDLFWYATLQRSSSIFSAYVEIIVEDDDDGDLSNGTPHLCEITEIFQSRGLTNGAEAGLEIGQLAIDRWTVRLPVTDRGLCPGIEVAGSKLTWAVRGQDIGGVIDMTRTVDAFEGVIPPQAEGEVLRYGVELEMGDGRIISYPNNAADPLYERFIGVVENIYCTDFETDPSAEGWSSELIEGTGRRVRNEWEWGEVVDRGFGDPSEAYSGNFVVGQDLGTQGRGTYQSNKLEVLRAPSVDAAGYQEVRLQYYRWLTVEDGDADQAEILAGDQIQWSNLASGTGEVHHLDREWRFHDVDLTESVAAGGGSVNVTFSMRSNQGASGGGWTIDDFCIVGWQGAVAACGDGLLDFGELCDDGNALDGDGCQADCTETPLPMCGNGIIEDGEVCDDENDAIGDGCEACQVVAVDPGPGTSLLPTDEGCACTMHSNPSAPFGWLGLLGILLALRRRR